MTGWGRVSFFLWTSDLWEHFHTHFYLKQNIILLLELKTRIMTWAGKNIYFTFICMWWQNAGEEGGHHHPNLVLPKGTVIPLISNYLLSTCLVPCIHSPGTRDTAVNKKDKNLHSQRTDILWSGRLDRKLEMIWNIISLSEIICCKYSYTYLYKVKYKGKIWDFLKVLASWKMF